MAKGDLEPQHSGVILASPSDSVSACLEKMATANVGSILIVDGKQILGILTERDLLKFWKKLADPAFLSAQVASVASKAVFSLKITDIAKAPQEMIDRRIRHIPLVDKDGAVIGIMSMRDVLKAMLRGVPSKEPSGPASILNVLTPTAQLGEICRRFVPSNWTCTMWQSVVTLQEHVEKLDDAALKRSAFMLDLDGAGGEDWRPLIRSLVALMKKPVRPQIFIVTSTKKFPGKDVDALDSVAAKANWHAYHRPLPVSELVGDLKALNPPSKP